MPIARALGLYRTTYISPNVSRFLGYPADMFVAEPDFWADLIHRDDRDRVVAGLAQLPEVGHIHHEYRMRHKSGAWRWVRDQVSLVRGDRNNPAYDYLAGIWIDVTADMLALEESEDRLRDYAESADDWFWETDEQFRFVEAWSGTSGVGLPFDRDSFRGLTRLEIAHEATDNQKWRDHQTALENHAPFRDFVYTRTDGEGRCRHIRVSGRPVFDDNGVFRGHRGAGSDVTKETEAEQILLSSEARFRTLVETSTQGILVLRFDDLLFANQAFADILGYADPDAIMALGSAEAWLPGDENTRMRGYAEERLRGGTAPDRYEFRGIRKDGSTVWLENNSALIEWEGETAILSTNTDITARHEAQEATKASELLYRSILDSMMDVYYRSDKDGRLVMVSPSMKDLLGYDVAESIGMEIADLYVEPEGPDQFTAALKASNENSAATKCNSDTRMDTSSGCPATANFVTTRTTP